MTRFTSHWWSIIPPNGWQSRHDKECATFVPATGDAAFQISAACKDSGAVTLEEIRDFAEDQVEAGAPLRSVHMTDFDGLHASFVRDGQNWDGWWLSQGKLLVFATFIRPISTAEEWLEEVRESLRTLVANSSAV